MLIYGLIAQLVEQRTENPRVSGSIPLEATTKKIAVSIDIAIFLIYIHLISLYIYNNLIFIKKYIIIKYYKGK